MSRDTKMRFRHPDDGDVREVRPGDPVWALVMAFEGVQFWDSDGMVWRDAITGEVMEDVP